MQAVSRELQDLVEETLPRLAALTEARASEKPFPEKWSLKEILGHLVDSAVNNHQRIVRMQERSDIGAFTYAQQYWVSRQHYQQRSWEDLVALWCHVNQHLAHVIAHIDPSTLDHSCDMGYAAPASLKFVVEDYVRHVRHHLGQILSGSDPRQRQKWVPRSPQG